MACVVSKYSLLEECDPAPEECKAPKVKVKKSVLQ